VEPKLNVIACQSSVKAALEQLSHAGSRHSLTLFVIDGKNKVVGSLTDGDVRRGLLNGVSLEDPVEKIMFRNFRFLKKNGYSLSFIDELRKLEIDLIPMLDENLELVKIIDLSKKKSILPIDVVIMAGGEGRRLQPLTLTTPKPLLKIGEKPIIEHNVDRLIDFGVDNVAITIKYLGQQLVDHFEDGSKKGIQISYVKESDALGTIGALSLVDGMMHDTILVMNSDLLTNIDFEDLYRSFITENADMAVATIPYQVTLPYGVIETEDNCIKAIREKPTYTYYSNGGIYLIKKEHINFIPKNSFFNATDLIDEMIRRNKKVINFPIRGYWLDIGKHEDYLKAQEDIKHIRF
jgi:dTDP-glucose pyrophosphorylase